MVDYILFVAFTSALVLGAGTVPTFAHAAKTIAVIATISTAHTIHGMESSDIVTVTVNAEVITSIAKPTEVTRAITESNAVVVL